MKDRLIRLLKDAPMLDLLYAEDEEWNIVAEWLIDKGVLVTPMSITEELRDELAEYVHQRCVDELRQWE